MAGLEMPYYKRFSIGLATSFITTYFFINNLLACDVFIVNFDTYILMPHYSNKDCNNATLKNGYPKISFNKAKDLCIYAAMTHPDPPLCQP